MKKYRCWVSIRKETTLEVIRADSSFLARQRLATRYGLKTFQIVAVRVAATAEAKATA